VFTKIAVPLDGSALAEQALPFALKLTQRLNAKLLLLRATEVPKLVTDTPNHELEVIQSAEDYMAGVYQTLIDSSLKLHTDSEKAQTLVIYGDKAKEIAEIAPFEKADLLVMSTHGRTGLSRLLLGSVAARILRQSEIPVILLRPTEVANNQALLVTLDTPTSLDDENSEVRILVTLDGTPQAEAALPPAVELARKLGATIYLLRAVLPFQAVENGVIANGYGFDPNAEMEAESQQAQQYLESVQAKIEGQGITCKKLVKVGVAADQVIDSAGEIEASILVIATHARGRIGRFFLGSVAEEVMRRTHLPIMMVHSHALSDSEKLGQRETVSTN